MYKVEVKHKSEMAFEVASEGGVFMIDAKAHCGTTPPDALLAGLASCVGVYIRKYAEGAKLTLDNFTVSAEAEFAKDPLCFKEIRVVVDLKGSDLNEQRKEALLRFIKNCPVHNTLHANPSVDIKLI
jgi:uncharacterized OsmC-like protein